MYYIGHMGFFGGMFFFWILFIALIIWLIWQNRNNSSPLSLAKERYAKGEITKKEYEEIKKNIA